MYTLICAHLHSIACKSVHVMHSEEFIIHLSASIKQKCHGVTSVGSTGTTLARLEHTKAPQGPKHGLAEDHGLKSGGCQALEISSKVG